jgi:hypothetical protein
MTQEQKIIRVKIGLLELAKQPMRTMIRSPRTLGREDQFLSVDHHWWMGNPT